MKSISLLFSLISMLIASSSAVSQTSQSAPPQVTPPASPNNSPQSSAIDPKIPLFSYTRVVPINESRVVRFVTFVNPDCSLIEPITAKILENPKHGKIKIEKGDEFPRFDTSNPLAICNNKRLSGVKVRYEPDNDFNGVDNIRFIAISGESFAIEHAIKIVVVP
jgi:hypothetical protein